MTWIPETSMVDIHLLRQDYARARGTSDANPTLENLSITAEVAERRYRAIRMIHEEDNASVRHLAAMFRCTKATIREALAVEEDQ